MGWETSAGDLLLLKGGRNGERREKGEERVVNRCLKDLRNNECTDYTEN